MKFEAFLLGLCCLLIPAKCQSLDCDGFGGCFCSTDPDSQLYLSWIAPDVGDYHLLCNPRSFGLRREGHVIHVQTDFHALVVLPLINAPLNFKIDPSTEAGLMTTVRCEDSLEQETENALVQKDSSVKKRPVKVEALTSVSSFNYHVFVVHYNTTLEAWTQTPRVLCRDDIENPDFACLPIDCNDCDPTTNNSNESDRIAECRALKLTYWNES